MPSCWAMTGTTYMQTTTVFTFPAGLIFIYTCFAFRWLDVLLSLPLPVCYVPVLALSFSTFRFVSFDVLSVALSPSKYTRSCMWERPHQSINPFIRLLSPTCKKVRFISGR